MKHILILSIMMLGALAGRSESVTTTTAGSLSKLLGAKTSLTELTVSGPINAADFLFINSKMSSLTSLNLTDATIEAYQASTPIKGVTDFAANTLPDYALAGVGLTSLQLPESLAGIGECALAHTAMTAIELPATLKNIGYGAFNGCSSLTTLTLPDGIESVDSLAFAGCSALQSVTYTGTTIPAGAFRNCTSLTTFNGAQLVTAIGANAFQGCTSLATFPFSSRLTEIGEAAFSHTGLTKANLEDCPNLTTVGPWAFARCSSLAVVTTPASLTTLGEGAFFDDPSLTMISLPSALSAVPDFLLAGATKLDGVQIVPESATTIGRYAFKDLSSMTTILLPGTLKHIADGAMENWLALDTINATHVTTVPTLGNDVWAGVAQSRVTLQVEKEQAADYEAADQWKEFNIQGVTGIEDVTPDAISGLKAIFEGRTLVVTATQPLAQVEVVNAAGLTLGAVKGAGQMRVALDTSRWSDNVYLVRVTAEDGAKAIFKLSR